MALYDAGPLARRWNAPGELLLAIEPASAQVTVARYELSEDGRYTEALIRRAEPGTALSLPPGSYIARCSSPGRTAIRYPFVIHRGERLRIDLELPRPDDIPDGFIYIPPGRFAFGSAAAEGLRRDFFHAVPLHEVRTEGYLIDRHETTFGDWLSYLRDLPPEQRKRHAPHVIRGGFQGALSLAEGPDGCWTIAMQPTTTRYRAGEETPIRYAGRKTDREQRWTRMPVVGISVADAERYVSWLDRTGRVPGARLCTEHEWERAVRGADGREYPHGTRLAPAEANHDATYDKIPKAMGPNEVGSHPASASPFGILDGAGNVWEWTRSSVEVNGYAARGGSWYFGANSSRTTDREITEPSFRDLSVGLRVCADFPGHPGPYRRAGEKR
jgi:formylglycine-generating enzyme required for sulfatase activity